MTTAAQTTVIDTEPEAAKKAKRRALLALTKLADSEGQWLRFTDRDGRHVNVPPDRVRHMIDNRYFAEQDWSLICPLDLIAEKAEALRSAHDEFQTIRMTVHAWYARRWTDDAARDKKEYPRG